MHFTNNTSAVARLDTFDPVGAGQRAGVITAKQTYRFDLEGRVTCETATPFPLYAQDHSTPLGILPADFTPRRDDALEVILLGAAYSPEGRAVQQLKVRLVVGTIERELLVLGDRHWQSAGGVTTHTEPIPFNRIPLVFELAYGGRHRVQLDEHTRFEVRDPTNPHGRGFDAALLADRLNQLLKCPPGFPALGDYVRHLPNLEDPANLIRGYDDAPEPYCWATSPADVSLASVRSAKRALATLSADIDHAAPHAFNQSDGDAILHRAHPDWVIPVPPAGAMVVLEHLLPDAPRLAFELPRQHLEADFVLDGMHGSITLAPQRLVLLPEYYRFYVQSRVQFSFEYKPSVERSLRLRVAEGWYAAESGAPTP